MQLNNLNIAVLGAGRSGRAAARLAMKHGARVRVFDASPSIGNWPEDIPLHAAATEEDGRAFRADLVVISPGIETDSPFVRAFGREGVETIGEMELACRFYHGRIIAITGTNGKTTTTSLVEKILLRAGKAAIACGNYGVPMAEILLRDSVPDVLALEVSSFQLETIRDFHPDVAVWLNFAPDHMDRYKSVEDYYHAKLHIFDNQTEEDLAVVRAGERLPHLKAPVRTFSSEDPAADLYYREPQVMEGDKPLLNLADTTLNQRHNAENAMAAVLQPLMTGGQTPWMLYFCGAALALTLTAIGVPALAFALGMFIPMELNAPLVVGGLVAWFVSNRSKDGALNKARFDRGTLIASGFIAGGALMGVVSAVLKFCEVDWYLARWAASNAAEWTGLAMYIALIGYFAWHTLRAKKEE